MYFFMSHVFCYSLSFVLLFIFMTQQYSMTSSSADFLCLSTETIVTKSIFRVNMYVILFLLNLQWLMTNTVSQNHNGR